MHYDKDFVVQKMRQWERNLNGHILPAWDELPPLELYMDQVIALLTDYFSFLPPEEGPDTVVTAAAINNYVRKKVMPPPSKKRYSRVHLAYLVMICSLKQCVSISYIQRMIPLSLTEEQVRDVYNAFVKQHRLTVLGFIAQMNSSVGPILAKAETADRGMGNVVTSLAVVSGLSRISAEALIRLQQPEQ